MTDPGIEIVRRYLDAWNRRDSELAVELSDPAIEYVNAPSAVEPGTRRGHRGIETVMRAQWEMLTDATLEVDSIERRGDRIFSACTITRPMPGSESSIEIKAFLAFTLHGGKVNRLEVLGAGTDFQQAIAESGIERPSE
jgi:hypothetical protein